MKRLLGQLKRSVYKLKMFDTRCTDFWGSIREHSNAKSDDQNVPRQSAAHFHFKVRFTLADCLELWRSLQQEMTSTEPTSTKSELLFEQFCSLQGIPCVPIECEGKKADYEIVLGGNTIVTELKQIDANESDIATYEEGRRRSSVAAWGNSDHRVRLKIQVARKQLKARSNGMLPTLLVMDQ